MATLKWVILLASVPAVFCAHLFQKSPLHEECISDGDCIPEELHLFCKIEKAGSGHCECKDSYFEKENKCNLKKLVGDNCTKSDECLTEKADCNGGKCKCLPGHSLVEKECVLNKLNDKCENNTDCSIANSLCLKNKCACKEHYFEQNNQCVAGLDGKCENSTDCQSDNTTCIGETCKCKPGFVVTPGDKCLPISQHQKECKFDEQCSGGLANSFCNATKGAGVCECKDAYFFKKDKCILKKWLDDKCTEPDECFTPNTDCDGGQCKCAAGHSAVEKECKFNKLKDKCEKDTNCGVKNSYCQKNKCACKEHYFEKKDQCVAGLDGKCQTHDECHSENTACVGDTCKCKPGFVVTPGDKCLPVSQHQKECKFDVQCSEGLANSFCNATKGAGVCECKDAYFFKKDKCNLKKWLDDKCAESDECFTPKTECNGGQCKCAAGHSASKKECVLNKLKDKCEKDSDCGVPNSNCQKNQCACKENYFELKNQCVAGLNGKCQKNDDCKSENTVCNESDKTCKCKADHVATPKNECLPKSQHHKECKYDVQCSAALPHTFCNFTKEASGVCECIETYDFQKDKCYMKKWVTEECNTEVDVCFTTHSKCKSGHCECDDKHPKLIDGECNSSAMIRPLFTFVVLIFIGLKVVF